MTTNNTPEQYEAMLRLAAQRLNGHPRRLFLAQVCLDLCDGNSRVAERRFGWGRHTIDKGLQELNSGVRCLENFQARRRPASEQRNPQLAQAIRDIVDPQTYTDPELKSSRRYSNLSASEVVQALRTTKGYAAEQLPSVRTMRDILNRLGYRLKRVQKGKPLKKTKDTDAIFANIQAVRDEVHEDAEVLEISIDTKAKVAIGDYVRGGKMSNGRRRSS